MGLGLRYDNLHLINLMVMVMGMEIIYHIDPKLPRVYMDQRKLLLIKSMLEGENLSREVRGVGVGEKGMDMDQLKPTATARRVRLRPLTLGHLPSNPSQHHRRLKSGLKSRIMSGPNLKGGKLDLNPNLDKHAQHPKHPM